MFAWDNLPPVPPHRKVFHRDYSQDLLPGSRRGEAMTLAGDMWCGPARRTPLALAVLLLGCAVVTMGQQLVEGPLSGILSD
ncbi:Hypp1208 [Branchiostoma lanceolatum]|uniref:Hypp1208 protein n=1 Tax=Branchiostoma lanceolatum TaxID=7740 RepID=A0A8K0EHQ0_BRALA|nr:Hypp1208 [Branchiostoma lanceolatum]